MLFIKDYNQWLRCITIDFKGLIVIEVNVEIPAEGLIKINLTYIFPKELSEFQELTLMVPADLVTSIRQDIHKLLNNQPLQRQVIDGRTLK
jgi:hypothetical protein